MANHIKRIWLYALVVIGFLLIFLSFFKLLNSYDEQKKASIKNAINHINRGEKSLNNSFAKNNLENKQYLDFLVNNPNLDLIFKSGNDTENLPINYYLKNSQNNIESIILLDSNGIFIKGYYKSSPENKSHIQDFTLFSDVKFCKKYHKAYDSLYIDDTLLITYYLTYPVNRENTTIGYIRITKKLTTFINYFKHYYFKSSYSKFINRKTGLTLFSKSNSIDSLKDANLLTNIIDTLSSHSVVIDSKEKKIITKQEFLLKSGNYTLYNISTPIGGLTPLQITYEKVLYSILLIIVGISLFFIVILYSRTKYHKLVRENENLNTIAQTEKKFRELFDYSLLPSGVHQNDRFVLVNQAGLAFIEASSFDEIKNKNILSFLHPDYREKASERIAKMVKGERFLDVFVEKFITLKGNEKIAEISAYPTEYHDKPAITIMLNDITERHHFIEKLKESEIKYRTLFEKLNDGILLIKDGVFVECNDAAIQVYGFTNKKELLNMKPQDLSPEKQFDGRNSNEKANEMIQLAIDTGFNNFEWQHKRPDGTLFWMDVTLTPIIINKETYVHVIGRDITEIKKIYHELEQSKDYLYNIIKRLPIPIIIYSEKNIVNFLNEAAENEFGFKQDSIPTVNDWWRKTIPDETKCGEQRENWDKAVENLSNDSQIVEQQWVIKDSKGQKRNCEFFAIKINGEVLVVINDISNVITLNHELLEAKEKAQESNKLKSAFLANLSHELRTPMNGILGFSQLLAASDLDDDERLNYVDVIQKSGNRLLSMINDIINISKIDANQIDYYKEDVLLFPIVSEIVEFHKLEAKNKNLGFFFEPNDLTPDLQIVTDEGKLKQILSNIIGNAVKYTKEGEIIIETFNRKDFLDIVVTDTGFGMKSEKQHQIFGRFIRLEETSDKTEGTGLGLAITLAYAKPLGIKIAVESKYKVGSKFTISIPLKEKQRKKIPEPEKIKLIKSSDIPDFSDKSILIAEDEELNFMILKLYIESTNATVTHALNGQEAVDLMRENHYDFVFMDIKMPVMDGMEAMIIIKSEFPETPVVAQTAFTFSEDKEKALAKGFDDYLSKPLQKTLVINVLKKFLL